MGVEFIITSPDSLMQVSGYVHDHFEAGGKSLKLKITSARGRSLDQNAFMHVIFGELSRYLINKGREDCNPEWVKAMLKNRFLGWYKQTFTDVVTGEKVEREVLRRTSKLDPGEACQFITQILEWGDSIGCRVKIPAECQYREMMERQNE